MSEKPQPNRLRFSLRNLFAVVTVAAIGSAALAKPTDLWASVVFSGTLGLLVVALLVAVARRSAGAIGFALCGCAYLGLILAPGAETNIVPNLVTSRVLTEAESKWHSSTPSVLSIAFSPQGTVLAPSTSTITTSTITLWNATSGQAFFPSGSNWQTSPFQRIGHSLFALLFAIVGSVVARWLWRGEARSDDDVNHEAGR